MPVFVPVYSVGYECVVGVTPVSAAMKRHLRSRQSGEDLTGRT